MSPAELIARVQRLLLTPATEWDSIAGEGADVAQIYQSYILPLTGIAALASLIGSVVAGAGIVTALTLAIVSFGMNAGFVYVLALIVDALAPQFGAKQDFGQAFKLAAYSPTASWVGSFFMILHALWFMALIGGLYTLYLLFVGLPKLMKPAADKAMIYMLSVIGCMIVIGVVASFIVRSIVGFG